MRNTTGPERVGEIEPKTENARAGWILANFSQLIGTFREFFSPTLFASTLFLGFTNVYLDFSCRTRLKTVELERDRMSHEVTKVHLS